MTVGVRLPYGPHWKGLEPLSDEISTCRPDLLRHLVGGLAAVLAARSLMLITGDSGAGKSFMFARALEHVLARHDRELTVEWLEFSDWARGALLLRELREQFCADGLSKDLNTGELRRDLRAALSGSPKLLVLDEAQKVNPAALLMLAKLLDSPDTNFALVILATHKIDDRYPEELDSRTFIPMELDPLADDEVVTELGQFHEVFHSASPAKLVAVNRTEAYGMFRYWAQVLTLWWQGHATFGPALTDDVLDDIAATLRRNTKRRGR